MASPSKAELWTMISNYIKCLDQYWKYAATNSPNYVGLEDALNQSLEGNNVGQISNYMTQWRSEINRRYAAGRDTLMLLMRELARFGYAINITGLTDQQILREISDAMHAATETIKNRSYSYGSATSGGSNVGSATVLRNVKDKNDYDLEVSVPGVQRVEVVRDSNMGATQGAEEVRFFGQGNPRVDKIQYGTSTDEVLAGVYLACSGNTNQGQGRNILVNGSFDSLEPTLTKAEQTGWTLNNHALFLTETTTFFRYKFGQGATVNATGTSLKAISGTSDIWFAQYIGRQKLILEPDVPYFLVLRVMVDNTLTDGTLTLRLGTQTTTLDLSTLDANVWTNLVIGVDKKGYYDVFKEKWVSAAGQDLGVRVRVDVASRSVAGAIFFDEIILAKGIPFNGAFYLPLAGQNTGGSDVDAQEGDYFTFTDTSSDTGRNQYTIAEQLGVSFPHTSESPTYEDA